MTAFAIGFALITLIPYLYGWAREGDDTAFTGVIGSFADAAWHLSLAEQVRAGNLLVENRHGGGGTARILNGVALFGGLASRATGLPPVVILQGVRTASAFAVAMLAYWFAAPLIRPPRWRWTAMILAVTGAGFGWLYDPQLSHLRPLDAWWVESDLCWCLRWELIAAPTAAALLLAFGLLDRAMRLGGRRRWVAAGLGALVLSAVHPHDVSTLFGVTAVWAAIRLFARARTSRSPGASPSRGESMLTSPLTGEGQEGGDPAARPSPWPGALLVLIGGGPIFFYTVGQVVFGSSFRSYVGVEQDVRIVPLVLGYGLLFVFGVVGAVTVVRHRQSAGRVHLVWAGLAIVGLLLPWPRTQRIFLCHALSAPMAVLAVRGLRGLGAALRQRLPRAPAAVGWLAVGAIVLVAGLTNIVGYVADLRFVHRGRWVGDRRPYLSRDDVRALAWLRANTDQSDLVAAVPNDGVLIAGFAGNRVYHGQRAATPQQKDRGMLLDRFFGPESPKRPADLRRRLAIMNARYVFFSDETRHEPTASILLNAGLVEPVYRNGRIAIYRVTQRARNRRAPLTTRP